MLTAAILTLLPLTVALADPHANPTITARAHATAVQHAAAATPSPLTEYTYAYSAIPYQVNPYQYLRGPQTGFNQCNSTTGGPSSECQTLVANNISDFCIWGSPTTDGAGLIGNVEAATVAYCTTDKHGARVIPPGALTGVQFIKTSAYIQITGHINQTAINLAADDSGGELDPHGADLLGNPLGGLVYSNGLPSASGTDLIQAVEWNNFVGGGTFCLKLCDPKVTSPNYCQNIFDLLGCSYNMPNAYKDGEFSTCDSDLQDVVGTYTSGGQTFTWSQPSSLPATSTLPWTPRIPASSNCVTYKSNDIFAAASTTAAASAATNSAGKTTGTAAASSGSKTGSSAASSPTAGSPAGTGAVNLSALALAAAFAVLTMA